MRFELKSISKHIEWDSNRTTTLSFLIILKLNLIFLAILPNITKHGMFVFKVSVYIVIRFKFLNDWFNWVYFNFIFKLIFLVYFHNYFDNIKKMCIYLGIRMSGRGTKVFDDIYKLIICEFSNILPVLSQRKGTKILLFRRDCIIIFFHH